MWGVQRMIGGALLAALALGMAGCTGVEERGAAWRRPGAPPPAVVPARAPAPATPAARPPVMETPQAEPEPEARLAQAVPDPEARAELRAKALVRQFPWITRFWAELRGEERARAERAFRRRGETEGVDAAWDRMGLHDRVLLLFGPGRGAR